VATDSTPICEKVCALPVARPWVSRLLICGVEQARLARPP